MIRVNHWTVAGLTATFLSLTLLVACTKVEPTADKATPAASEAGAVKTAC